MRTLISTLALFLTFLSSPAAAQATAGEAVTNVIEIGQNHMDNINQVILERENGVISDEALNALAVSHRELGRILGIASGLLADRQNDAVQFATDCDTLTDGFAECTDRFDRVIEISKQTVDLLAAMASVSHSLMLSELFLSEETL